MIIESPLELIFRDLFYRLPAFAGAHDVFLKLEGFNITGSIKVKTAIGLIEDLEERGIARPKETVIVESSSGNLGLALSLVCAIKGYEFICVTDPNANRAAKRGMELNGTKVVVVTNRDAAGGFLGSRLKKINQILRSNSNAIWLNWDACRDFRATTSCLPNDQSYSRRPRRLGHVRWRARKTEHSRHWCKRQAKTRGPCQSR